MNDLNLDIIGIAESHLKGDDSIELDGYQWFGNNRKALHFRARTGSGGVGFFIHNDIASCFNIKILDNSFEGILWLEMRHKFDDIVLLPCVCYLPPENSSRHVDVLAFFDKLLTDLYEYQNIGVPFLCGDFNSRCGDSNDFIVGIDPISERHVIDYKSNAYGDVLI